MQQGPGKVTMEEAVDALAEAGVSRDDGMAALEREMASNHGKEGMKSLGFVSAGVQSQTEPGEGLDQSAKNAGVNEEEIGLDDEDDEVEEDTGVEVAQKSVPDSVFGNLAKSRVAEEEIGGKGDKREQAEIEPLGAKERFKRQKQK